MKKSEFQAEGLINRTFMAVQNVANTELKTYHLPLTQ